MDENKSSNVRYYFYDKDDRLLGYFDTDVSVIFYPDGSFYRGVDVDGNRSARLPTDPLDHGILICDGFGHERKDIGYINSTGVISAVGSSGNTWRIGQILKEEIRNSEIQFGSLDNKTKFLLAITTYHFLDSGILKR